jgi:hypothetical protein
MPLGMGRIAACFKSRYRKCRDIRIGLPAGVSRRGASGERSDY